MDDETAPSITDADTTIEDNSVTVIVETPEPVVEPESEPEPDGPTLETVLAMIAAMRGDMAGLQADMTAITARLDDAARTETSDSEFSETIESAAEPEPEPDTGPTSSHFWFRSVG